MSVPNGRSTGFAKRLKELREKAGLSQAALADAVGLNRFTIAKLEQKQTNEPRWTTVIGIAAALGVTPNDFLHARTANTRARKGAK